MTTQSNPSPFSTDIKSDNISPNPPSQPQQVDEFEIRTMKDDMVRIKSGGIIDEKKVNTAASTAIASAAPFESVPSISPTKTLENIPESKKISPTEASSEKINLFPEKPSLPAENADKLVEIPTTNNSLNSKPAALKILLVFVFVLIVAIIGLGAYYFLLTKKNNSEPVVPSKETETPITEVTTPITTEIQEPIIQNDDSKIKYSEDKPNYLPIDINNLDASGIKASIVKISDELKDASMKSPYEFIIVDTNNNPVSFPIFIAATKINLSQALLASLGTDFSLYLYNDNSKIRTGLNVEIKNESALTKELAKQEKTIVRDASFLFLNDVTELNSNTFATSSYGKYSIRYCNASVTNDLSIDYSIINSRFVLGTSKDTERALIDKISKNSLSENINQNNCNDLAANLLSCSPYMCESVVKQEIKGVINGKCNFIQYLPNNYKTNCSLTQDMQQKVALSIKEFQETGNASFSTNGEETKNTINGKQNALQEAMELGQCVVDNK